MKVKISINQISKLVIALKSLGFIAPDQKVDCEAVRDLYFTLFNDK